MQLGRLDIEDPLDAIGRGSASLLDDESKRVRFVKQTKLAALVSAVGWVREQSTPKKVAVEIGDERADIACIHRLAISILTTVVAHQILDVRLPLTVVRVIH